MNTHKAILEAIAQEINESYYILARNRGMWGIESPVTDEDGKVIYYDTKDEATARLQAIKSSQPKVNNLTEYFVVEGPR